MVILHLTTFLQGGAGLVIASLAASQRAAGHEVLVATTRSGPPGYGNYPGHLQHLARAGVPVSTIDSLFSRTPSEWSPVLAHLLSSPLAVRADVCHAHAATPTRIALAFCERIGARPIVQTMHGWGIRKTDAQTRSDVDAMNLAARVAVPARTSAALLEAIGVAPSRLRVIEYGVAPPGERRPLPTAIEADLQRWRRAGGVVLCCPGTIGERKNQRALLHALSRLESTMPAVCILFVGDGETTALADEAARLDLGERVRVCGYEENARQIAAAADFLVLPSLSEGQPLSVLEAFADGVPTILSNIPELRELLGDTIPSLTVDPRDPADIARTVARAVTLAPEDRRRLARQGRQRWAARFSAARMCEAYLDLYTRVLTE